MKPKYFVETVTKKLRDLVGQISRNQKLLDDVRELDRQLAKLTHMRERLLGQLAHAYLNSSDLDAAPVEFEWIIEEIQAIERSRQQPQTDSATSLATLVVPTAANESTPNQDQLELMTVEERQELYRRRLRGLYLDLAEMILAHRLVSRFPDPHERVQAVQSRLEETRIKREAMYAKLPSSTDVLHWAKKSILIAVLLLLTWIWI